MVPWCHVDMVTPAMHIIKDLVSIRSRMCVRLPACAFVCVRVCVCSKLHLDKMSKISMNSISCLYPNFKPAFDCADKCATTIYAITI